MKKIVIVFLLSFFCIPFVSFAYETIEVKNGGSIEGTVEFVGAMIPREEPFDVTTDSVYCGKSIPSERYEINPERKVKNVIVYLEGIKAGMAIPNEAVTVTNLKCIFMPHVGIGFKGQKLIMKNDDPMFHTFDVHAYPSGMEVYSASFPDKGSVVAKTLRKSGLLELSCYAHPWQHAYVYVFDHPYAAITDEKGKFVIKNIPPGTYDVEAWHEGLGKVRLSNLKVESGKPIKINLEYKK
jgi:hypothetical protein